MSARAPFATVALLLPAEAALAQAHAAIPPRTDVVITGSLRAQRTLEAPFAITRVDSQALREAGR